MSVFEAVVSRSGGMCESMIRVNEIWTRCGRRPIQIHHTLTRARGGRILDAAGELYHLIALCPKHHTYAHSSGSNSGLLLDGYVTDVSGSPVYYGSDPYLRGKYADAAGRGERPDPGPDLDHRSVRAVRSGAA